MSKRPAKKEASQIVLDFQNVCKQCQFQDNVIITQISNALAKTDGSLRIANMQISVALGKVLQKFIQKVQRLDKICLYSCVFEDPSIVEQLAGDIGKISVSHVALDYLPITREQITPFISLPIDSLSLRGNQCLTIYNYKTREPPKEFPETFNRFLNSLTTSSVKVLNLSNCHLGDAGAIGLAKVLFMNNSLKCVSLIRNRIGDDGAVALASALSCYVLKEEENALVDKLVNEEAKQKISDEGSALIKKKKGSRPPRKAPPPKVKKGQTSLHDRLYNFDPAAPIHPAVASKWNLCVEREDGSKIIPGNRTLTMLILDDNEIGETGSEALVAMLRENEQLTNFSINHNPEIRPDVVLSMNRRNQTQEVPTAETAE